MKRQLLAENKFSKYLLYAIGEIILVVIGILIALNINNRNTENTQRADEQLFFENIKQQLLDDAQNIESQIRYNTRYNKQFEYAVQLIGSNDRNQIDSLGKIAVNLLNYSDFDRQGNIYETMINSGDVKLIQSDEIIDKLRRLEETYIYVNRMEAIHAEAVFDFVPEVIRSIRLSSSKIEDVDYLYDYKFQNLFVLSLRIMDEKEVVYRRALKEINAINSLINNELK